MGKDDGNPGKARGHPRRLTMNSNCRTSGICAINNGGNSPNWPSKVPDRDSGGGRDNNPPKSK